MIYSDLIFNLSLLISLTVVSGFLDKNWSKSPKVFKLLQGILFGTVAVIGMYKPMVFGEGIFFDGRSVMISLCALFFGPVSGLISSVIAAAGRLSMGGTGYFTGVLVIFSSFFIGYAGHMILKPSIKIPMAFQLAILGFAVHVAMLLTMLTLPGNAGFGIIKKFGIVFLLYYPIATVIAGKILADQHVAMQKHEELRESEGLFKNLFVEHSAVKLIADPESKQLLDANRAAESFYGWTRDELRAMKIGDLNVLGSEFIKQCIDILQKEEKGTFEVRHRTKDGRVMDVLLQSSIIDFKGKKLSHTIVQDITDRKEAEVQLDNNYRLLKIAGETASFGGWSLNAGNLEVNWSPEVARIHGRPDLKTIPGDEAGTFFPEPYRQKLIKVTMACIEKGISFDEVMQVFDVDGKLHWVRITGEAEKDIDGKTIRVTGAFQDISTLRQVELENQRLLKAFEQADEIIVITNGDGIIEYVNKAYEKTTGYSSDYVTGKHINLMRSDQHTDDFYHSLWATISSGKVWTGRFNNRKKDGRLYTEDAKISPVFDESGKIINYVSVKRDITEQLKLEAQFRQAQKMESIGRLAGGIAHDFNNMLSVIMGYSDLILQKLSSSDPMREDAEEIMQAAKKSAAITKQLLAFARKQAANPQVIRINETVDSMVKMLRRLIGEDMTLNWKPGKVGKMKIDPSQLEQILVNLCVNSRDAISGHGTVSIETGETEFDHYFCEHHPGANPGHHIWLTVSDDGCGMDDNIKTSIFEPFFTTKEAGKGTGLGLATVFGIVKQNDGYITVESEIGKGSTFKIYFPISNEQTGPHESQRLKAQYELLEGNVMLVEDDPAVRRMGKSMLEAMGFSVIAPDNTSQAIELASKTENIQLLITDIIMPEMNGKELAVKIKALKPAIKVIYISGYTSTIISNSGLLEDGINFIQKPFSQKELQSKIISVLS